MTTDKNEHETSGRRSKNHYRGTVSQAVYGFGMIGAWIYFIGHATTFWIGVLGFLKGIVWPVLLVYEAMKFLQM